MGFREHLSPTVECIMMLSIQHSQLLTLHQAASSWFLSFMLRLQGYDSSASSSIDIHLASHVIFSYKDPYTHILAHTEDHVLLTIVRHPFRRYAYWNNKQIKCVIISIVNIELEILKELILENIIQCSLSIIELPLCSK